jgi:hypothetical protein
VVDVTLNCWVIDGARGSMMTSMPDETVELYCAEPPYPPVVQPTAIMATTRAIRRAITG